MSDSAGHTSNREITNRVAPNVVSPSGGSGTSSSDDTIPFIFESHREQKEYEYRQTISEVYVQIARNKNQLRFWLRAHIALAIILVLKLTPFLLDKANIFILSIEELEVPEPLLWEWIWLTSITACFMGFSAIKKNSVKIMRSMLIIEVVLGVLPLLFCFAYYLPDFIVIVTAKDGREMKAIQYWKGLPYAVLNNVFVVAGAQVHGFAIYWGLKLVTLWNVRLQERRNM